MAVMKVIELVGTSTTSWEDAGRNALAGAAKSLHGIKKIEISSFSAAVTDGEIAEYQALIKLFFVVD